MVVTTINADGLLETSEAEDVNMSDILNTVDEEILITPEDEHCGSPGGGLPCEPDGDARRKVWI